MDSDHLDQRRIREHLNRIFCMSTLMLIFQCGLTSNGRSSAPSQLPIRSAAFLGHLPSTAYQSPVVCVVRSNLNRLRQCDVGGRVSCMLRRLQSVLNAALGRLNHRAVCHTRRTSARQHIAPVFTRASSG